MKEWVARSDYEISLIVENDIHIRLGNQQQFGNMH